MRKQEIVRTSSLVGLMALLTGCTAFGTYAGWQADRVNAQRDVRATRLDYRAIPAGYPVEITMRDGRKWYGRFAGAANVSDATYAARYDSLRQELSGLPPLNEMLEAARKSGQRIHVRFAGFQPEGMAVRTPNSPPWAALALDSLDTLSDIGGRYYSPTVLKDLLARNELPLRTAVRVRWNGDTVVVPLELIEEIHAGPVRTNNWAFGLALGIVADALVMGTFIRSIDD